MKSGRDLSEKNKCKKRKIRVNCKNKLLKKRAKDELNKYPGSKHK